MTVSELIKALREFDGDLEVKYHYDSAIRGETHNAILVIQTSGVECVVLLEKSDLSDYDSTGVDGCIKYRE